MALLAQVAAYCALLATMGQLGVNSDNSCDFDIENTLRTLLSPQENSMQVQALRRDVLRKFQVALNRVEQEEAERDYKRSLSSLAAWNNLPEHKRNLEALARAGYIKTLPDDDDGDSNYKRSIATLAKNGQLPVQNSGQKRGIESLARNGDLYPRRDVQQLMDEAYDKRNIGSLARGYNLPSYGKRSLSSLAKSGDLAYQKGQFKRNIQSLAREGKFTGKRSVSQEEQQLSLKMPKQPKISEKTREVVAYLRRQFEPRMKRSAQGGAEGKWGKREAADYFEEDTAEDPLPIYQNPYEYEDFLQDLTAAYPNAEKRFLGSVARTGWFQPSVSRFSRFTSPEKRHIGSLARLGWLPSFRNVRRFNRSGRSTSSDDICREVASDGETQDYAGAKGPSLSLEDKRYLLQPAVDNILLRKVYMHPRAR